MTRKSLILDIGLVVIVLLMGISVYQNAEGGFKEGVDAYVCPLIEGDGRN